MRPHNAAIAKASMARSLKGIALVVTLGTLLSKAGGLVRQLVIAAAFGVGAAYDAYNYAYVLLR
jgi:putative peptidoglycan lipid II flippase